MVVSRVLGIQSSLASSQFIDPALYSVVRCVKSYASSGRCLCLWKIPSSLVQRIIMHLTSFLYHSSYLISISSCDFIPNRVRSIVKDKSGLRLESFQFNKSRELFYPTNILSVARSIDFPPSFIIYRSISNWTTPFCSDGFSIVIPKRLFGWWIVTVNQTNKSSRRLKYK